MPDMSEKLKGDKPKSVLDGVPVKDTTGMIDNKVLEVVGACPKCGSPIYGHKYVSSRAPLAPIPVHRSCACA